MWTVINGVDRTDNVNLDLQVQLTISDPLPNASFTLDDPTNSISLDALQSIIIWDENTVGVNSPSHNMLVNVLLQNDGGGATHVPSPWTAVNPNASLFSWNNNQFDVPMTFNNSPVGTGYATQTTQAGYAVAGQAYMFSIYMQGSGTLSNILGYITMEFHDVTGSILSTVSATPTITLSQQRFNVSGTAPAGTTSILVGFGGDATVNGSNSGTITFSIPQLEPMWFTKRGVSYPTPAMSYGSLDCALMADGTTSRENRVFTGWLDDVVADYTDDQRIWTVSATSLTAVLDSFNLISVNYSTGTYDDTIIKSIVDTYFPNVLSYNNLHTQTAPTTVQRGVQVQAASWSDSNFREILNSLISQSGFVHYVDAYGHINYNPVYWNVGSVSLSDQPDYSTSFAYRDYTFEKDATQIKNRVKVIGANITAPAITDTFSGNGSTKVFNLTQPPDKVTAFSSPGGSKCGVNGVHTFAQGYTALYDKGAQQLIFNTAPASGTNNISITYTFTAPVSVIVQDMDSFMTYGRWFDAKVNDSAITDTAAAISRGQAELTAYSKPLPLLHFSTDQFFYPGTTILFTSSRDGYTNAPFTVQNCTASFSVAGVNQYQYDCGAYVPGLIDHIRNLNKALNRSASTAGVTTAVQTNSEVSETLHYSDSVSATLTAAAAAKYGTAKYGFASYS